MDKVKEALGAALDWAKANTSVSIPLATFVAGIAIGAFFF